LPAARFTPVFPPIELSIIDRRVVGTWIYGMPRIYVDASNPAMSPTTPPPSAMMTESRSNPFLLISLARRSIVWRFLDFSPCGNESISALRPAFRRFHKSFPPYSFLTFESVIIAKFGLWPFTRRDLSRFAISREIPCFICGCFIFG